jgi:hypothetical protein
VKDVICNGLKNVFKNIKKLIAKDGGSLVDIYKGCFWQIDYLNFI